ncbi:transposase (plasmid) [Paracoccus aminophilus JCM 7686]|uniref:Transposase n=1 Tax=Paracoccus aminophilus JCM 7686 TaxID=1367847 RepID=S5Z0P9_PARAH|nr:transposase [Paracoccus aminophilus JCM 7686]
MACAAVMRRRKSIRQRPSTIAGKVGATTASSPGSWWPRHGASRAQAIMIEATTGRHVARHQVSGRKREGRERQIGRSKGGMNTKLHAVADSKGRPIWFYMSAGQVSDYTGGGTAEQSAKGGLATSRLRGNPPHG